MQVIYNGKTITATTTKNLSCLQRAVKIAEWMEGSDATVQDAAKRFNCADNTVLRCLKMVGIKVVRPNIITIDILNEAIDIHIETGSINEISERYFISVGGLSRRMREVGYSLKHRDYINLSKPIDIQAILCGKLVA